MKTSFTAAIALVIAIAAPSYAQAAGTGTVCGRVDAPAMMILALQQSPSHDNVIFARSSTDEVQTLVNTDGTYCLKGLQHHVYTLSAFNDGFPAYSGTVTPVAGKTVFLNLYAR